MLWYILQNHVNPSTTTGATGFKDEIENATLKDFKYDIKAYHIWFGDWRSSIIKKEGVG